MMEDNKLKLDFSYTDEFGQESRLTKTFTDAVIMDTTTIEFLVEEFKCFLLASGFRQEFVDKIQYVED